VHVVSINNYILL